MSGKGGVSGTLMPACYYCHLLINMYAAIKHVKKADVRVRLYCRGSMGTVETVWVLPRQYGYCRDSAEAVWVLSRQYGYCRGSMGTAEAVWVLPRQYGYCRDSMGTVETVWVLPRQYGYCRDSMGTAGQAVWVLPRQYSVVSRFPDRPHYSSGAPVITHTLLWVTAQEVKNLLD